MFIYLVKISGNKLNGMHPISAFDKKPKSKKGTYYFHITKWQKQNDCFFVSNTIFKHINRCVKWHWTSDTYPYPHNSTHNKDNPYKYAKYCNKPFLY